MSLLTLWLISALLLAGLEMLTGTFYLLAVATGLLCAALLAWLGAPLAWQVVSAALVGVLAVVSLHLWYKKQPAPAADIGSDIGQLVEIASWQDERRARVRYRGTLWDAELESGAEGGQHSYMIAATEGSLLILKNSPQR